MLSKEQILENLKKVEAEDSLWSKSTIDINIYVALDSIRLHGMSTAYRICLGMGPRPKDRNDLAYDDVL